MSDTPDYRALIREQAYMAALLTSAEWMRAGKGDVPPSALLNDIADAVMARIEPLLALEQYAVPAPECWRHEDGFVRSEIHDALRRAAGLPAPGGETRA